MTDLHYEPRKEKWLMNPLPGFTETKDIGVRVYPESSLDYGEFMRSTTPQERVEAIHLFLKDAFGAIAEFDTMDVLALLKWAADAAGPQGYEQVPLDWIRKLRQRKAGTSSFAKRAAK